MKRLFVVTLLMVFVSLLCGFTLFGGDISTVQKMILEGTSRSITDVISQYKYIKNVSWSEEEVDSEKHVVLEFEYDVSFEADNPRWASNPAFSATDGVLSFSQWVTKENESPTSDSCFPLTVKVYFSLKDERHPLKFLISTLNAAVINVPAGDGKSASTIEYVPYDMFQQMEQKTWLSFAESPLASAYFAYRQEAERVAGQANHEKLLALKTEMSQVLSRLPKPPAGSFVICQGEGTVPGHITGSVYTLEGISLDTNPAHREASIEDRAFMSVWHFSVPTERKDSKGNIRAQGTGSKLYMLNNIQREPSGFYSVGWKADGFNFALRWSESEYDLFWKDGQRVELMEFLNPQEAFINACINKVDSSSATVPADNAAKHMVVGDHEVTISGEPYEEQVFVNGGLAYDNADGDRALNIKEQFKIDGGDTVVFFLETLSGGTACPAQYRFIFAESDGQVSITDGFGTCSDLPELRVSPENVVVVFPNMNGSGTTSYRLQGEDVVEMK